jgi:hypothetical protein
MFRKMIFSLFLLWVLSFIHSLTFAQLGPNDGADLRATDLDRVKVGQPAPDFSLAGMDGIPREEVSCPGLLPWLLVTVLHRTAREAENFIDETAEREGPDPGGQCR